MAVTALPIAGPSSPGSLRALATRSLSTFLIKMNALGLSGLGVTLLLDPPTDSLRLNLLATAALWLVAAAGVTAFRLFGPSSGRVPAHQSVLAAIPVVMSVAALAILSLLRTSAPVPGPLPSELMSWAILSVTLVGTLGVGWWMVATLAIMGWAAHVAWSDRLRDAITSGVLLTALPLTMLLVMTATAAVLMNLLRQSAQRLDGQLRALDARAAMAEAAAAANGFAAEVTRSLHDSALNTLEAITLSGPHLDPELVRQRALADARAIGDWLDVAANRPLESLADDLGAHARRLGLTLRWESPPAPASTTSLPAGVAAALRSAAGEALTNVAKHSGVKTASASVVSSTDGGVTLRVDDAGRGVKAHRTDDLGFGTTESIAGRMAAVGGSGLVVPRPRGGTRVILSWSPTVGPEEQSGAPVLLQLGGQAVAAVAIGAAVLSITLTVLLPGSFRSPWAAVLSALLAAAIAGYLAFSPGGWRAQTRADDAQQSQAAGGDAALVILTYLAGTGLMLVADPQCVSVLALPLAPHPGILLLVALVFWDPRRSTAALLMGAVLAALVGSTLLPSTSECAVNSTSDAMVAAAGLILFGLFTRTTLHLGRGHALSRRLSRELVARTHEEQLVGAERAEWLAAAIGRSQALLTRLASGDVAHTDPQVRQQCRFEASLLRAILVVGQATPDNRRHLRCQLNRVAEGGHLLAAKGNFRDLDPPVAVIDELREWARAAGRAVDVPLQVTLFAWSMGAEQGLHVLAEPISDGEVRGLPERTWEWATGDVAAGPPDQVASVAAQALVALQPQ